VAYPVTLIVPNDRGQNRVWGIPFLGLIVRGFMVIPQAIVIAFLGVVIYFSFFVNWIPILLNGRAASWMYQLYGGYLRMTTRSSLYVLLAHGTYPPFWITGDHPVDLLISENQPKNRWWGIPIVGVFVRWIVLLPHLIVIGVLGIVLGFLAIVSWAPILINGRQADAIVRFLGGLYQWTARVVAYGSFLTEQYPPFSLELGRVSAMAPEPAPTGP
jgi:hypothetical protein